MVYYTFFQVFSMFAASEPFIGMNEPCRDTRNHVGEQHCTLPPFILVFFYYLSFYFSL